MENNVLRRTDNDHAAGYLFTHRVQSNSDLVEEILATVDQEET